MALVAYPSSPSEASSGDERDAARLVKQRRSASPDRVGQPSRRPSAKTEDTKRMGGRAEAPGSGSSLPAPFASAPRPLIGGRERRTTGTDERAKRLAPGLVPGQWLCYVFVEIPAEAALMRHLRRASDSLSAALATSDLERIPEPHISLSRPLAIEGAERADFLHAAKGALRETTRTTVAFARYTTLVNDDSSRLFFAVEVGMGWQALRTIAQSLDQALRPFGLKPYYAESRFHASFASIALPTEVEQLAAVRAAAEAACAKLESDHGHALRELELRISRLGITVGDKTHVYRPQQR